MTPAKPTYLNLKTGLRFVSGPRRSAIYEMSTGKVYSVDPFTTRVLSLGMKNVPVGEIPRRLRLARNSRKRRVFEAFLHHPFVQLSPKPNLRAQPLVPSPRRHLEFLWIELTATCNLRCRHCYASSGPNRLPGEITEKQDYHLDLLRQAAALGCRSVQLTGGEIFLRKDLLDLVREARKLGFELIELYTNATLIRDSDLDVIQACGAAFAVSLYSHREEAHDAITLVEGSWRKAVANIRRICGRGIPIRVGVVQMKENWNDMEETRRFLVGLGIPETGIRTATVLPTGRGCEGDLADPEPSLIRLGPPNRFHTEGDQLSSRTCWSGKVAIDPDGNVFPCVFSRGLPVGNVKEKSLAEVIGGESLQDLWSITLEKVEDCRDCEYRYACFDCRLRAYALTGEMLAKPPTCAYQPHDGKCEEAEGMPVRTQRLPAPGVPRRRCSFSLRMVDGEAILLDRETQEMHVLNPTAARIWQWCDGDFSQEEIVEKMSALYAVGRNRIARDVGRALDSFRELGLLE